MSSFAERLKELRQEKRLSQDALAEILDISQTGISYWELGVRRPTSDFIIAIAKYFNVTTDYLLGVSDD